MKSFESQGKLVLKLNRKMTREEVEAEVSRALDKMEAGLKEGLLLSNGEKQPDPDEIRFEFPVYISIPHGPCALDILNMTMKNIRSNALVDANNCVFDEHNVVANREECVSSGFDIEAAAQQATDAKKS